MVEANPTRVIGAGVDLDPVCAAAHPEGDIPVSGVAQPELTAFFDQLYGPGRYSLARHLEPRERFTVDVKAEGQYDLAGLLSSLS